MTTCNTLFLLALSLLSGVTLSSGEVTPVSLNAVEHMVAEKVMLPIAYLAGDPEISALNATVPNDSPWPTATSEDCQSAGTFAFIMSIFLAFGMLVSYLPQIIKIISKRSSEGLSPIYLCLGALCQSSTMLNALVLYSKPISCCKYISSLSCAEKAMNFVTLSIQMTCFATILIFYPFFYPKAERYLSTQLTQPSAACTSTSEMSDAQPVPTVVIATSGKMTPGFKLAKLIVYLNALYLGFGVTLITMLALFHGEFGLQDPALKSVALVYGIISVTLTCIQYLPQLWKTFSTKSVGSLSILTLAIQCPGSFVLVWSITQDKGPNFSTWGPYAIAGTFQGILLLMCLFFTYVRPNRLALRTPEGSTDALQPQDSNASLDMGRSSLSSVDSDSNTSLQGSTGPLLQPVDAQRQAIRSLPQLKKEHVIQMH